MADWKEISPKEWNKKPFQVIGNEWMLVTAEKDGAVNTMTASWGGVGIMWGKNTAFVFVRPERYTKEFIDASDTFSLTFYDEEWKKQLSYLGSVSGRDEDKIKKAGLTPANLYDTPYFEEANTVLICKKLYAQELEESFFLDKECDTKWYPNKDYHTMYVVEITNLLIR